MCDLKLRENKVRIFLIRVFISFWAIPLSYILFLPLFYLMSGDFKKEINHINDFVYALWSGFD